MCGELELLHFQSTTILLFYFPSQRVIYSTIDRSVGNLISTLITILIMPYNPCLKIYRKYWHLILVHWNLCFSKIQLLCALLRMTVIWNHQYCLARCIRSHYPHSSQPNVCRLISQPNVSHLLDYYYFSKIKIVVILS